MHQRLIRHLTDDNLHKLRKEFAPDYEIINTTKFIYHP